MCSSPSTPADAPVLIAGPTASGKSALALRLAETLGGCVVNADALQVYAEWRVLTARPDDADLARAPHALYGHVPAAAAYSVGAWLRDMAGVLADCAVRGLRPIVVGGTGLYFDALTRGLADIPPPSPQARAEAEDRLRRLGREGLFRDLAARDPATAAAIDPLNPVRLTRAWEVLLDTGRGLAAWRAETPPPLVPRAARVALTPARDALYARCDARFDAMLSGGALEEARAVAALDLPPAAPALRAVGAAELIAHLQGRLTLEQAAAAAKQATRNYAKRQLTWIRNRMADWPQTADAGAAESRLSDLIAQTDRRAQ
jgi:tRNA dimethylallyltransferase